MAAHGESRQTSRRRAKRERPKQPLVLCGHGVLLRVENGALTIRNGFTHYPQKQETYRFFKGELTIPPRIIMLDGSGSISFDVLAWLSEQNVPLIHIDWQGNVQCVLANNSYAANPYRVEWQRETRGDPKRRMAFCIDLIAAKSKVASRYWRKASGARPHGNKPSSEPTPILRGLNAIHPAMSCRYVRWRLAAQRHISGMARSAAPMERFKSTQRERLSSVQRKATPWPFGSASKESFRHERTVPFPFPFRRSRAPPTRVRRAQRF
jgi:hypothetical protein